MPKRRSIKGEQGVFYAPVQCRTNDNSQANGFPPKGSPKGSAFAAVCMVGIVCNGKNLNRLAVMYYIILYMMYITNEKLAMKQNKEKTVHF